MRRFAGLVCWLVCASALHAQNVRVMQWNILGGLGNKANNTNAQARAIARVINYNQPDILLFNEIASANVASNTAAIIDFVTNSLPYLGTQPGVTFYVAVSSKSDGFNRNAAVSRYPISGATTYDDGLRGLHAFRVQLAGTNTLQLFHAHLKCCADDCPRKQNQAQFGADVISGWGLTNTGPYIYAGDLNEDEENPICTLTATYHPITTILQDGEVVQFRPTTLSGQHRTWSTAATTPSVRLDYIFAASNRLAVVSGYVFNSKDWAAHGLYTNASPQNLVNDSQTASDHYSVFADYVFPTDTPPNLAVHPTGAFAAVGPPGGPFSPPSQTYTLSNTGTGTLNWTATHDAAWLTVSPVAGALAAGASTTVVATINASADSLLEGGYAGTIGFTNTTNGAGNTTRPVSLTVSTGAFGFFDNFATFVPGHLVGQNNWSQLSTNSGLPLQISAGQVVIPFGQSGDNQDAYKNFAETNIVVYYGLTLTMNIAPDATNPSYFAAMTLSNNGGFANYRLSARAGNAANTNYLFGIRITGQGADPYNFGTAGLNYGTENVVIVASSATGSNMTLYVNPTSNNLGAQTPYLTHLIGAGATPPPQVGSFVISQFASATVPNVGLSIAKVAVSDSFAGAYNALLAPAHFVVSNVSFNATGPEGGPFAPDSATYTLSNTNSAPLNWSVNKNAAWLTLSATAGTLAPGASTNITASINSAGNFLDPGVAADTISFTDTGNGGVVARNVTVTVLALPSLAVAPATPFNTTGLEGGPFTPSLQTYTLSNIGSLTLNWTATKNAGWLNLSATNGAMAGGGSAVVTASVNATANSLPPGSYNDSIQFANTDTGEGDASRTANLTVMDPSAAGFFDNVESGTNGWTASGMWHVVQAGTPSCAVAHSGVRSWWFGQNSTCNYRLCGGCAHSGNLISPPFVVPNNGTLTYWSWEDTEGTGTVNDQRIVFISTNATTNVWIQLHQSVNDAATWHQVSTSVAPYAGRTARLRFFFNANAQNNRFRGWFVDDIQVLGPATLVVTPAVSLNVAGEEGGPFSPAEQTYTLSNPGADAMNWTAGVSNNWLSLSAVAGTLASGASTNVTVRTNANVNALVGGLYSNRVNFVNATNGAGTTNRVVTLLVRDGIPDAWREQFFGHVEPRADDLSRAGDDADGDGFTNMQEWLAGTTPTDAGSAFRVTQVSRAGDGTVTITWSAVADKTYRVQYKDDPTVPGWSDLAGDVTATGGSASKSDTSAGSAPRRSYRVILVQN